jgi:thiol-disulfide isomerase/thioredoxin
MPLAMIFIKPKYLLVILWLAGTALLGASHPYADNHAPGGKVVNLYLFWAKGCPHCLHEEQFLAKLAEQDQDLKIHHLEVTESRANWELFKKVGELLGAEVSGVPFTVAGNQYVVGWQDEQTTGLALKEAIRRVREEQAPDVVGSLLPAIQPRRPAPEAQAIPQKLTLPLVGEINLKYLSLGMLTIVIGALDGFNPCAMWVLIFLINLLLGMEDRKKMWLLGGLFILASAVVYFLFMTAWLNLLVFLGFIVWVRIIIGLIALFAGAYNLREYYLDKIGVCKLTTGQRRQRTMGKIKEIVETQKILLAMIGIVLLAFAVNLVELICSAGFPVIYLQILSLNPMPFWQYYLYIGLYIFIFMLDDMIVFVVAMITLQLLGATTRYKRASNLIGGVLMLLIGALLILKPEYLMFG